MKKIIILLLVVLSMTTLFSQENTQEEEMVLVKKSDLPDELAKQIEMERKIEQAGKFVGLGKEIGTAMNESLAALTETASKFADTKLGKFTLFLVAYKVIGKDLIQYVISFILLLVGIPTFIHLILKNCITRKIPVETDEDKPNVIKYETYEPSSDMLWGHFLALILYLIVISIIAFA